MFCLFLAGAGCGGTEVIIRTKEKPDPKPDIRDTGTVLFPDTIAGHFDLATPPESIESKDGLASDLADSLSDQAGDVETAPDTSDTHGDKIAYPDIPTGCTPGDSFCVGNQLKTCDPSGTTWVASECGQMICVYDSCRLCFPGTQICQGPKIMKCNQLGDGYDEVSSCDFEGQGKICQNGSCISPCEILESPAAATMSNVGCEYWGIDMDQSQEFDGYNAQYAIVVSNTNNDYTATVKISVFDKEVVSVQAPPNMATIIPLPPLNIIGVLKQKLSYRVHSDLPIVAYQFNPLENVGVFSNDASLLLPTYALGKEYMVMAWPHRGGSLASNFAVVGTQPGTTTVTIKPSVKTAAGGSVPSIAAGQEWSTTLEQFEVLNIESQDAYSDLTGSWVSADQKVAVFGGHVCANCPPPKCVGGQCPFDPDANSCGSDSGCPIIAACDHLEEQLQPISAWGKEYLIGKTWPRGKAPDYIRIMAAYADTVVTVSPPITNVPVLQPGKHHDFETLQHLNIKADKPILVGQYLEGQDAPGNKHVSCDGGLFGDHCGGLLGASCNTDADCSPDDANIGDPAFIVGVASEQYREKYVFLVPTKYASNYVTVVAPTGTSLTLDGTPVQTTFEPITGSLYGAARMALQPGSHRIEADNPVGITVYGWDQYVSYGYPGGMNLQSLPQ